MKNLLQDYLTKQEASKWLHNSNDYETDIITNLHNSNLHSDRINPKN